MQAGGTAVTGDDAYVDPRWNWPEYGPGTVVEVRVHGIGGEGPEGMTRDPHPVRVGGDDGVGFWRARNPMVGAPTGPAGTPPDPHPREHAREVVSWGGSTSGTSRSSFWVLLLPFALFNAAGRMTPPGASDRRAALHQSVCRVLALSMSLAVVALTTGLVIDLVALQCGAQPVCSEAELVGRWVLTPLHRLAADAAALVAVLALLPVVAIYLLRWAGRRQLTDVGRPWPEVELGTRPAQQLHEPDFWQNLWPAWRLRGIHITAGYAWVVAVLALALPPLLAGLPGWIGPTALAVGVVSLVGNAVLAALPRTAAAAPDRVLAVMIMLLRATTLVALGALFGTALSGRLTGVSAGLAVGTGIGAAAFAAVGYASTLRADGGRRAGPSGAWRDVTTFAAAVLLTAPLDVGGAGRLPIHEALTTLRAGDGFLHRLLAGAPYPVYAPLFGLVAVQVVLLLVLLWTGFGPADRGDVRTTDGPASALRTDRGPLPTAAVPANLGAPVVALTSLLLVTAVAAGLQGATLDWLGERVATYDAVQQAIDEQTPLRGSGHNGEEVPTDEGEDAAGAAQPITEEDLPDLLDPRARWVRLSLPWWLPWTAFVVVLTMLSLVATAYGTWRAIRRRKPPHQQVEEAIGRSLAPDPPGPAATAAADPATTLPADSEMVRARGRIRDDVVRSWHLRVLTEWGGRALFVVVAVPTVVVMGLVGRIVWLALVAEEGISIEAPPLASLSMLLVAALPPLAVAAIRTARSDRGVRRQLGRIWDVLAFWPRLTHPFAPPSYGEAVVPAVAARVRALTDAGHPVVLAGHSQGSIIALAATLQLVPVPADLHLVTYGSPLRLLYEGMYPDVFGTDDGAIARATPTTRWPTPDAQEPSGTAPATWHNVLVLGEPIGTPLWSWSVLGDPVPDHGDGPDGWDTLLRLPYAACPVCAWRLPGAEPPAEPLPRAAIDCTITDPDRVTSSAGEVDGAVAGHSAYHRSRELDLHLHHLAHVAARD